MLIPSVVARAVFPRRAVGLALIAATLGGCTTTRPVTAPTAGMTVRIHYTQPLPSLAVQTSKYGEVELRQVRRVYGRIVETRGDSVAIRLLGSVPGHNRIYGGTSMVVLPGNSARAQKWTSTRFSPGKTAAVILIPIATLYVGFSTACWC